MKVNEQVSPYKISLNPHSNILYQQEQKLITHFLSHTVKRVINSCAVLPLKEASMHCR